MSEIENLAELILSEPDRPVSEKPVPTPEWPRADGKVYVRALSGDDRDRNETALSMSADKKTGRLKANTAGIRARVVTMGACHQDGNPIFTIADVERLGKKSAVVLDRIYDAVRKISGMDNADDAEKNYEATTGESSS